MPDEVARFQAKHAASRLGDNTRLLIDRLNDALVANDRFYVTLSLNMGL